MRCASRLLIVFILTALVGCSDSASHGGQTRRDAGDDAGVSDAAVDSGGPPPPLVFDAAAHEGDGGAGDAALAGDPVEVRCSASGVEAAPGLELIASDGLLEAFTVRADDDAVFATVGADLGNGLLHRAEDGALERFGDGIDEVDALHVLGDALFVAIARDGEPLVIAKLDATTGARTDLATEATLGEARAIAADQGWVYWAADAAADPPGGQVLRAPRAGGASELLSELPAMFLPEGARIAEDSLRVSGALLVYIARAGEFTSVFRGPSDRMASPSPLASVSAVSGLPAGVPTDVGAELDGAATFIAFAHNAMWSGPQGVSRIEHDAVRGTAIFETGAQQILGLTSDAGSLYWMMRNREGTVSLFRGHKDGTAPEELATGFQWSHGLAVSDRYVYFMLSNCPADDGKSLVRIPKR